MTAQRRRVLSEFCVTHNLPVDTIHLLDLALTHKSHANELPQYADSRLRENLHNQRLEFLGDSVLGLVIAEKLYRDYPLISEGELTKRKARAVCEPTLYEIAEQLNLERLLVQGKGERHGQKSRAVLADAVEAVIAAIFLSSGIDAARGFILPLWEPYLNEELTAADSIDYKSWLQVFLAQKRRLRPEYRLISSSGPDHRRTFIVSLFVQGYAEVQGEAGSRKKAEQQAAKAFIEKYDLGGPEE